MPIDRRRQTAIIQGLIFGAGFGVMQGLLQRSLPYGVRGRPVHDPALGPATIVHARAGGGPGTRFEVGPRAGVDLSG